jgi:hypothetical protein
MSLSTPSSPPSTLRHRKGAAATTSITCGESDDDTKLEVDLGQSVTELPWFQPDGKRATEVTPIPTADPTKEAPKKLANLANVSKHSLSSLDYSHHSDASSAGPIPSDNNANANANTPKRKGAGSTSFSSTGSSSIPTTPSPAGPRAAMTGSQVAQDESRLGKFAVRSVSGISMISAFVACVYMGHIYVWYVLFF